MSLSKADTDVILNKANIALARSQRLVASWLPAAPATGENNAKADAELQKEEEEIFTAVPETCVEFDYVAPMYTEKSAN
jgi:hypothetical protein